MDSSVETDRPRLRPSVFVSYASQDRDAAVSIRDTLAASGVDGWCDESDLGGGDAWDQKIRRQIRECDYFMPIVSSHTEARREGYFRREWRLAVERSLDMADDRTFLLPVVIDDTDKGSASVPEKFLAVQWLKVPNGKPSPPLVSLCERLVSPRPRARRTDRVREPIADDLPLKGRPVPSLPFPTQEPGQGIRFIFQVIGWVLRWTWLQFKRWPRLIQIGIYAWVILVLVGKCSNSGWGRH